MPQPQKQRERHGQIVSALKKEASHAGKKPNDVYNQFFREVFLHELMRLNDGWVLKGGTNIYCRIPGARQTKDLDLFRQYAPTSALKAADSLIATMNKHRVGPYTFQVEKSNGKAERIGTIDSKRLKVTVTYGLGSSNRFIEFSIDVSGDLEVTSEVESVTVASSYDVQTPYLPEHFQVTSYPIANQIADKVCAMYEIHGDTPPGKASTRYHDLYDIALLASELPPTTQLNAAELRDALNSQQQIRGVTLPTNLNIPDATWADRYPKAAKKFGNEIRKEFLILDEALRVAALLIDPILNNELHTLTTTWNSATLSWTQ
ncbi:nucleotidyl transferase AbiEii/AbiGii toxin family protein [Corynebacterium sp. NML98-0116]|uniref:nucleotidyl transferase AbiEii/AbiGii toxin family protein n=1 Tax=Corynebacterium sp. NML98-0116 TaxID=702967 RepID=UPI001F0A7285|nr:nucleotidyl transferase AbiEii/AbiGii toxin family protein [Corynebacterium sp. NML98-0116]